MKKFLIPVILLVLTACCQSPEVKQKENEEKYYLNENFILVDAKENIVGGDNGQPYKVRTWIVERISKENPDTVYQAEISTTVDMRNCNCSTSKDFVITNELWFSKPIGSILHFDHIRKDRFYKRPVIGIKPVEEKPVISTENSESLINLDGLSKIEVKILIDNLQRKYDEM